MVAVCLRGFPIKEFIKVLLDFFCITYLDACSNQLIKTIRKLTVVLMTTSNTGQIEDREDNGGTKKCDSVRACVAGASISRNHLFRFSQVGGSPLFMSQFDFNYYRHII
jgi:hypothetical protein